MYNFNGRRHKKHDLKCLILFIAAGILVLTEPIAVMATSTAKLEQEKQEAQEGLDEANEQAYEAQLQKGAAEEEVESLRDELTSLLSEISLLEIDIAEKQIQIEEAQAEYDEAVIREEDQYEAMKKRIRYMYEKGDTEFLDILLQVTSMADFLNKSQYISDIYEYDREKLIEYQETKELVLAYREELDIELG